MNTRGLLDQLLKSGQQLLQGQGTASPLNGALAGGAIGLLLGNRKVRKLGGKALAYGGLAAIGVMAYKAYGNWQAQQQTAPRGEPQTLDRLPAADMEEHSLAILQALVAAAKADGHVDTRERQLLDAEFARLGAGPDMQAWLQTQLNQPLDPVQVARAAKTTEMAAEMYLASVMMVDEEHFMERAYLDELARQLALDPLLKEELEGQVRLGEKG